MLPPEMQSSRLYGVELDSITGRIAQKLYPNAEIKVAGFETTDRRDFYDLAVGNVPFGNYKVSDKPYDKLGFSIHNYFFAKALDQVRPGGVVAFVTSRYTMDSKNSDARRYMAQRAELLGAIRLPNDAFKKNAGTEVVSDILFLQKRDHPIDIVPEWVNLDRTEEGHTMNSYFVAHPEMVLGDTVEESTAYGMDITVRPIEGMELSELLKEAVSHIQGTYQAVELPEADKGKEIETIPATPDVKNFSYTVVDGNVYFRENSLMRRVDLNEKAKDRVMGMVELRGIVNELIEYQLEDYPDEMITQKQAELNDAYDAFAAKNGLINNRANGQAFADDSSYYLLCSLENVDEDGNLKSKADMFTKRTIKPERRVTSVDLQYSTLQQKNLTHFDSWASTFGETTTAIELAPEGTGYRARTRFAKFFNLPELMNMFKEVADIKTSDQLHLPVPEAKFETVVVQPSEYQKDMVASLSERAADVHAGIVDPSVDNMLKITSDGRKLGLDQRLMNTLLPDDPDSKLNACVGNILRIWQDGQADKLTQLVFCDLSTPKNDGTFNVY